MIQTRQILIEIYLDFINNYLTVKYYATCNALTLEEAQELISLARKVYNQPHPES